MHHYKAIRSWDDSGEPLLPNRVAQFLSSRVTQFVSFESFPGRNAQDDLGLKYHNYLKNKENYYFLLGF